MPSKYRQFKQEAQKNEELSNQELIRQAMSNEQEDLQSQSKIDDIESAFETFLGQDTILHVKNMIAKSVKSVTSYRAFFKEKDIVRKTLERAQREVEEDILEKSEFEDLVRWEVSLYPFVKVGNTNALTTVEMWGMENKVLELASMEDDAYIQPQSVVEKAILKKKGMSEEQRSAVEAACLSPRRITVIEGSAGAGKSYTMEAVKDVYMDMGYEVMGTALAWSAAKVLGESAKLEDANCVAIEGLTRSWISARENGTDPFQGNTLIIVDEAGMVGTKHMSIILEETQRSNHHIKVVLTGDSLQVTPVAAGNSMESIIEFHGTTRIDTIRRQKQESHRKAVKALSRQHSGNAIYTFLNQECFNWCNDKDDLLNCVVQKYLSYKFAFPENTSIVISLSNEDVLELNYRIRSAYKKLGLIDNKDINIKVTNGIKTFNCDFSIGDEVILRSNDKNMMVYEVDYKKSPLHEKTWKPIRLGVFNRNFGKIVAIRRSKDPVGSYDFTIDLKGDNPGRVIINSDKFRSMDKIGMPMIHNYAGTIYSSQGQTVNQTFIVDSPYMNFRLAYVGLSRHKEGVEVFLDETELHRRLDKTLGKHQALESRLKMDKEGKKASDAKVSLGRYTRSEMLNAVSLSWGKYSENMTAVMHEHIYRVGNKQFKRNAEKEAKVVPVNLKDQYNDYIHEFNQPYPLIDIEKIFNLPDPVSDSELIRPSDVEINREKLGMLEMPVDASGTPLPIDSRRSPVKRKHVGQLPTSKESDTLFGKAFSWLNEKKQKEKRAEDKDKDKDKDNINTVALKPVLRQTDPESAFDNAKKEYVNHKNEIEKQPVSKAWLDKLNYWVNPKPQKKIPYEKTQGYSCGKVVLYHNNDKQDELNLDNKNNPSDVFDKGKHTISFEGVPKVKEAMGGPSDKWLSEKENKLWAIGKYEEPRIIAKNPRGLIVSRYKLDGTCVVGEGFPAVSINKHGSEKSPVYIVAGAKEWLWLCEFLGNKYKDHKEKIPHIIWAAKDMDWSYIASSLKYSSKVTIVRSKIDEKQIPWAKSVQNILWKRYKQKTTISPKLPSIKNNYDGHSVVNNKTNTRNTPEISNRRKLNFS